MICSATTRIGIHKCARSHSCLSNAHEVQSPPTEGRGYIKSPSMSLDSLCQEQKQLLHFLFGQAIAFSERPAMRDQIFIPCFDSYFIRADLTVMPFIYQTVIEVNREEKSGGKSIGPNDLISRAVIANYSKLWEQGVINFKWIVWHRLVNQMWLSRSEIFQSSAENICYSFKYEGNFCSNQSQERVNFIRFFLLFSPFVRLILLPRNPDGHKNRPHRAYCLQPSGPVSTRQIVVTADHEGKNCQDGCRVQDEARRACNLTEFGCHHGIVS